jgi:hypothetical protein
MSNTKNTKLKAAETKVDIGNSKDLHDLYNEKLKSEINLNENVKKMASRVKKEPKELTEAQKKRVAGLSKYRAQVKEALELKKSLDNKHLVSYEESEESEEEVIPEPVKQVEKRVIKTTPVLPPLPPPVDLKPIYAELESMKKKNAELEERFTFRNSMLDFNNMRRNMSIKF